MHSIPGRAVFPGSFVSDMRDMSSPFPVPHSLLLRHTNLAPTFLASSATPATKASPMPTLRLRVTGSDDDARAIMNLLQSLDGIEHVEEVADLMPHMDDADSSSAGLSDLRGGTDVHEVEIEAPNDSTARKVREAVEALAFDLDVLAEFGGEDED